MLVYLQQMKRITTIFLLFISCICPAQDEWERISDSLTYESRGKADVVLAKIRSNGKMMLLYSLQDKYYYVIIKQQNWYSEFYIIMNDISSALDIIQHDHTIINEQQSKKRQDKKILKQTQWEYWVIQRAFNLDQYSTTCTTRIPNATYIAGVPSYFVIKDENNKRYGEYSLSSITIPCPIHPELWVFLQRKMQTFFDGSTPPLQ